jgi:apolipoprotein N-acyltransferase
VDSLPLSVEGIIDETLPVAETATVYSKWGKFSLTVTLLICLMLLVVRRGQHSTYP